MADVAIITSIYDGYDSLKPILPQEDVSVDWVFVTDEIPEDSLGWRVIQEKRLGVHPNRAAKRAKMQPWKYTNAPMSVWVDGSFRINSPKFAIETLEMAWPIAQFKHPWRDCLFEEAICTQAIGKYEDQVPVIKLQAEFYDGRHPKHWGLWATGVIARRHTLDIRTFGHIWHGEITLRSFQDQISHPFALRRAGIRPTLLPGTHFSNPWLTYEGSARH